MLLLGGGGFALIWFFVLGGSGSIGSEAKFFPDGTQYVVSIRVDEALNSSVWKTIKKDLPGNFDQMMTKEFSNGTGLGVDKIERLVVAGSVPKFGAQQAVPPVQRPGVGKGGVRQPVQAPPPPDMGMIMIMTTKESVKASDITALDEKKGQKYTESSVGKYTVYSPDGWNGAYFCVVDSKTVVLTQTKKELEDVLKRDKKPELSSGMETAIKKADFSQTVAFALNLKDMIPKEMLNAGARGGPDFSIVGRITAVTGYLKAGSDLSWNISAICDDAKTAQELKTTLEGFNAMAKMMMGGQKEVADMIDKTKYVVDGSTVTSKGSVTASEISSYVKKMPMLP